MSRRTSPLRGRVAVVTGGAGLLGLRFARALAMNGAKVGIADIDEKKAEKTAEALSDDRRLSVRAYRVELPRPASVLRLKAAVERDFGPVDILVNNAAAKTPGFFRRFEDYSLRDWNAVMDVNLGGPMVCSRIFGGDMAARGCGSIVNVASIYGVVGADQRIYERSEYLGKSINTPAVYSASKAGLLGLTRYLAAYWGHAGVRVNAITPGGVYSGQNDEFVRRYSQRVPLGRMARVEELEGALLYLVGDSASYVTGHNLIIDGGWTAW